MHNLLIATVGGKSEPVASSILHWRPDRVIFVPSSDTEKQIVEIRDQLKSNEEYRLGEGQFEMILLSNHEDFTRCVQEMRSGLEFRVSEWRARGDAYGCIVDFTGGTKCMSAALASVARPWPGSKFSYIGGKKRDLNNVGVVVSGSEQVVHSVNPWDALGYQVIEDAIAAFDLHAFDAGSRMLRSAMTQSLDGNSRKSEFSALATFMDAYNLWSRSEYGRAFNEFEKCEKRLNDLAESLRPIPKEHIQNYIDQAKSRLKYLKDGSNRPTRESLEDLISDAARRRQEGRHVDAVARLYRAVEATAQLRLWNEFKILSGKVAVKDLPESMRERLVKQSKNGTIKLGLQESYEFLIQKRDTLGERFKLLGWNGAKSPLSIRNDSIAGHGFAPVSSKTSDELWKGALELAEISEDQIFRFPCLRRQGKKNFSNP